MTIWVLVADSSRARFFSTDKSSSPLEEVTDMIYPEARMHDSDLTTDTDNRGRAPKGTGSHGPGDSPAIKDELASRFAGKLCEVLQTAHAEGKFHKLYIIAAPGFLGTLRKCRSLNTDKLIAGEVDKNLCTHSPDEIRSHLPQYL
jgi:protein required for attachment to host cells